MGDDDPVLADIPDAGFAVGETLSIHLDEYVTDCDHRSDQLEWDISGNVNIQIVIDEAHIASLFSPSGWTGSELLTFQVSDPDMHLATNDALITVEPGTAVSGTGDDENIPGGFALCQNYPNPFNATTTISYQLSAVSDQTTHHSPLVTLKIYNLLGQEVRVLVDEIQETGHYQVTWDGRDHGGQAVPSGIYSAHLRSGPRIQTRSMVLLR